MVHQKRKKRHFYLQETEEHCTQRVQFKIWQWQSISFLKPHFVDREVDGSQQENHSQLKKS